MLPTIVAELPTVVGCGIPVRAVWFHLCRPVGGRLGVNFNEKLIELRKSQGLSQDELGERLGVSRQTVSKWELAQSYPDFQRLVSISDYFGLSLDELVRDVEVQDVRERSLSDMRISSIYDDVGSAKSAANAILNAFAAFGVVGVMLLLILIAFFG